MNEQGRKPHKDDTQRALERAVRSLAMRAHSEQELVDKLTRAEFDERAIAGAMAKLAKHGMIDDDAFAQGWVQSRARRGLGARRIAHELQQKGVAEEIIEAALSEIDEEDALEAATTLALKQLRKGGANARRRANEVILRRGFDYDIARQAMDSALETIEEEQGERTPEEIEEEQAEILEAATELAYKRLSRDGDDFRARQRTLAALSRREIPYDIAKEAIDAAVQLLESEDVF